MDAKRMRWIKHDLLCKEGIEYIAQFWELSLKYADMTRLEAEMEYALLVEEKNQFHRACADNNKIGRRHMLPFYWTTRRAYDGTTSEVQVPITIGTMVYEKRMADYARRLQEIRRRMK